MTETAVLITTTVNDEKIAKKIADALIKKKLAACVHIKTNIQSVYTWENKICHDVELEISIKTVYTHSGTITKLIKRQSYYDIPQIIVTPILAMSDDYEKWYMEQISV